MVLIDGDAYWVSRRLDNIASCHAGAFWIVNPCGKARAALLQMTQGKMTVLEYFDAFESYLAQLEDYDESFFLAKFILGLRHSILTQVMVQHPATLLEAKGIAEELELTQSMVKVHQREKKTIKAAQA